MPVQNINSCQYKPSFGKLYVNPAEIEKTVGKRFADQAVEAIPRLKTLAENVDIEVFASVSKIYPKDLSYQGFKCIISKIPEKPVIKNPIKRFFHNLTHSSKEMPYVRDFVSFEYISSDKRLADELVDTVEQLKAKFINLGGMD